MRKRKKEVEDRIIKKRFAFPEGNTCACKAAK